MGYIDKKGKYPQYEPLGASKQIKAFTLYTADGVSFNFGTFKKAQNKNQTLIVNESGKKLRVILDMVTKRLSYKWNGQLFESSLHSYIGKGVYKLAVAVKNEESVSLIY